ncbi:unnamed protein product [Lathyrus oleraceus]
MVGQKTCLEYLIERNTTFLKRKNDLFQKACELSILCGAKVCVFGFSPTGNPFAFGSPSFHAVIDEYLNEGQDLEGELSRQNVKPSENGEIKKLYTQLRCVTKEMKAEKKKMGKIDKGNVSIIPDDLGFEELLKVKASLKKLQDEIKVASSLLLLAKKP